MANRTPARRRQPRQRPAAPAPATGTAVVLAGPLVEALDAAQAHAEWIVAVEDAYAQQVYRIANDLLADIDAATDAATAETLAGLAALDAAEHDYLAYHRAAHTHYVALVCASPVWALPAPYLRPVQTCPPEVLELEASPMGQLGDRLDLEIAGEVEAR